MLKYIWITKNSFAVRHLVPEAYWKLKEYYGWKREMFAYEWCAVWHQKENNQVANSIRLYLV